MNTIDERVCIEVLIMLNFLPLFSNIYVLAQHENEKNSFPTEIRNFITLIHIEVSHRIVVIALSFCVMKTILYHMKLNTRNIMLTLEVQIIVTKFLILKYSIRFSMKIIKSLTKNIIHG